MPHRATTTSRYHRSDRRVTKAFVNKTTPATLNGNTAACEQKSSGAEMNANPHALRSVRTDRRRRSATAITSKVMAISDEYCLSVDAQTTNGTAMENMRVATIVPTCRRTPRATTKNNGRLTIPATKGTSRKAYSENPSNVTDSFTPSRKPGGAICP